MKNIPERISKKKTAKMPRVHKVGILFNAEEYRAIERHLKKYRIKTKSKWFRSVIMSEIWKKMSKDYPTLFNEEEMR